MGYAANKKILLYCLISIGAFICLFPFLWMILTSFKTLQESTQVPVVLFSHHPSLKGYIDAVNLMNLKYLYFNTVFCAVVKTAGWIVTCSMAGYAFGRIEFPGRNICFLITLSVLMVPSQVFMIPNFRLIASLHWANSLQAIIVPGLFSALGTFVLRQAFMVLPKELEEAAVLDGCGHFGIFSRIMFPMVKSSLVGISIISFTWSWNDLMWPMIVNSDQRFYTLAVGIASLRGTFQTNYPDLMAGAVMASLPLIIVFFIFQKQFIEGIAMSGIKG